MRENTAVKMFELWSNVSKEQILNAYENSNLESFMKQIVLNFTGKFTYVSSLQRVNGFYQFILPARWFSNRFLRFLCCP